MQNDHLKCIHPSQWDDLKQRLIESDGKCNFQRSLYFEKKKFKSRS